MNALRVLAFAAVFPCSVAWGADLPQSVLDQLSETPYAVPASEVAPPLAYGDPISAEPTLLPAVASSDDPMALQLIAMNSSDSPVAMAAEVISACNGGGGGCVDAVKALMANFKNLSPIAQEYLLEIVARIAGRLSPDDPVRLAIADAVRGAGVSSGALSEAMSRVSSPTPSSDRSVLIGEPAAGSES